MKIWKIVGLIIGLSVIAAGIFWWLLSERTPDRSHSDGDLLTEVTGDPGGEEELGDDTTEENGDDVQDGAQSSETSEEEGQWITRLFMPIDKPEEAEVTAYLERENYSVESLLAAAAVMRDVRYIRQAADKSPDDSQVQLAVILEKAYEDTEEWIERLKRSAPDNALGNYFAAEAALNEGNIEEALKELEEGGDKVVDAYSRQRAVGVQVLYASVGADELHALASATLTSQIPHGVKIYDFADTILSKAGELVREENTATAGELILQGLDMSNRMALQEPSALQAGYLAVLLEERFTKFLEDNGSGLGDYLQRPLEEIVSEIREEKQAIQDFGLSGPNSAGAIFGEVGKDVTREYFQRMQILGEWEAMKWLGAQRER